MESSHTNSVVAKMYIFRREMSRMDAGLNANFHPDVDFERARARNVTELAFDAEKSTSECKFSCETYI